MLYWALAFALFIQFLRFLIIWLRGSSFVYLIAILTIPKKKGGVRFDLSIIEFARSFATLCRVDWLPLQGWRFDDYMIQKVYICCFSLGIIILEKKIVFIVYNRQFGVVHIIHLDKILNFFMCFIHDCGSACLKSKLV